MVCNQYFLSLLFVVKENSDPNRRCIDILENMSEYVYLFGKPPVVLGTLKDSFRNVSGSLKGFGTGNVPLEKRRKKLKDSWLQFEQSEYTDLKCNVLSLLKHTY